MKWVFINEGYIWCHQHACGAIAGAPRAIGRATKIHLYGCLLNFKNHWSVYGSQAAPELIELVDKADYLIADKGSDSDSVRDKVHEHSVKPMIPNMFARLKQFCSIATECDKLAHNFN